MRLIDADRLLSDRMKKMYYHLPNGDIAIPLIDIEHAPTAQPEQRWIPCGKCIHADGKHRWCKVLDRTINEDYFCYWAEPLKEGEAE